MRKLSAVIITFNEARNIKRCIASLQDLADEIVVIDSFSTDATPSICKSLNVQFHQRDKLRQVCDKRGATEKGSEDTVNIFM